MVTLITGAVKGAHSIVVLLQKAAVSQLWD